MPPLFLSVSLMRMSFLGAPAISTWNLNPGLSEVSPGVYFPSMLYSPPSYVVTCNSGSTSQGFFFVCFFVVILFFFFFFCGPVSTTVYFLALSTYHFLYSHVHYRFIHIACLLLEAKTGNFLHCHFLPERW